MNSRDKARVELKISLLSRGCPSIRELARRLGYNEDVLTKVIYRWWGRKELPRGKLSRKIILDVKRFLHDTPPLIFSHNNSQQDKGEDENPLYSWREDSKNIKGAGQ